MSTATITLVPRNMKDGSQKLQLSSPYHPDLPAKAKALGGRFNYDTKLWYFDLRDSERVRAMCVEIYGIDPLSETPLPTKTIRVALDKVNTYGQTLWLGGKEIAHRPARDSAVRLGPGVVIIEGGFAGRGGSAKYPDLAPKEGTVLEIRDLPEAIIPNLDLAPDAYTIVEDAPAPVPATLARVQALITAMAPGDRTHLKTWLDTLIAQAPTS